MKFGHLELFVRDPLAAAQFYTDALGFRIVQNQHDRFIWLSSGALELLLRPGARKTAPESYQKARAAMVLYVEDVEEAVRRLRAAGVEPKGFDGDVSCPTFTDRDGNWFQLVDPERR